MLGPEHIDWLERLSGYDASMIRQSVDRIDELKLPGLAKEMGRSSGADGHLAGAMLCQSIDWLTERGIPLTRLRPKLKRPDTWPMWAEVRAAGLISHLLEGVDGVELDVPVASGRNSDFGFHFSDGQSDTLPVEFKALGLSYTERQFCKTWAPLLRSVRPPRGICTLHANMGTDLRPIGRQERRRIYQDASRRTKNLLPQFRSVSATVVVAHGSQPEYVARMTSTITDALSQLPATGEGWIALHWGNGAPHDVIADAVRQIDLPEHVAGVMLVGSAIVLDGRMHHALTLIPRDSAPEGERVVSSRVEGFDFAPIMRWFESSAGVRPAILRVPIEGELEELIVRDGSEVVWPFNVLLAPDPRTVRPGLN